MYKFLAAIPLLLFFVDASFADPVLLTNTTENPIYRLYAWPSELGPRTFNILGSPLFPGSSAEVDIDNSYGDCIFDFQYDPNSPSDLKKRNYKRKSLGSAELNICKEKNKIKL